MNILIVDDEEVLQDVLTALVREEGHEPLCAHTGEEALTLLDREEVDLVLLYLMLPGMSGMEVLKQIRERNTDLTVVVITVRRCLLLRAHREQLDAFAVDRDLQLVRLGEPRDAAADEGTLKILEDAGATILPTGCGGCIGLGPARLEENMTGISSTNRNFVGRAGEKSSKLYLGSAYSVAAAAITGEITDPREFL